MQSAPAHYALALRSYLERPDEATLNGAYELGRSALAADIGLLELMATHQATMDAVLGDAAPGDLARLLRDGAAFLRETLSPYEMSLRGFRDANARLASTYERHVKRLRMLHQIDEQVASSQTPQAIAGAVIEPLRDLLQVPRAIVNMFDLAAGEVEWLAAAGRKRTHVGPGVRYSMRMMGDLEALKRGEPQHVATSALGDSREVGALEASGVKSYMVVPMIAGGELIGAISFGGESADFSPDQMDVAREVATQLAIAVAQAHLYERVARHAEELELRVRERTAELQEANKQLEAFSYSVAHDLRAPLRSIDGFSKVLLEDHEAALDAEGRKYLRYVTDSAQHMGQLIDALLSLSRLNRAELARRSVDLSALAGEIVAHLRRAHPARSVEVAIQPGLSADADPGLIAAVLQNLLGNAWKFTASQPAARIEFGAREEDGRSVFFVRDNGAGFDMKYAENLFAPFKRLHSAAEFEGTGIGLATVQRIVKRHGGEVWAQGEVGAGATIRFTLRPAPGARQ